MQFMRGLFPVIVAGMLLIGVENTVAEEKKDNPAKPQRKEKAKIGQEAPSFELTGADGKTYKLDDYKDKVVVLEWISKDCPWSVKAVPLMKSTHEKYNEKGVVWLAIDSTHWRNPEDNVEYAKDKGLKYPILTDKDGKVGRTYGAKTTPHIFIIDKGKLVYMGGHDNRGDRNYIAETLDAVLADKDIPSPITKPYGCTVKYKKSK